jgi:TonB family protein
MRGLMSDIGLITTAKIGWTLARFVDTVFLSMRTAILAFFLGLTVAAISQDRSPEIVMRPSGPVPHWDKGEVVGRTYKNASVGIELTPPTTLEFGAPELKGNPGTLPLVVTITAAGEYKPATTRKVMAFYTDALAYYPSTRRSTDDYMRRIVRNQQNDGYEPIEAIPYGMLGGVAFARHDFKKGVVYESALVKACDSQALVFIFGGADEETVNELSAATELKLDPATSGCVSNAAITQDKPPTSSSSTTGQSSGKQVYRVSGDVKPPRVISGPQPNYPQQARKGHVAGPIVIWMVIDSDGRTRDIQVQRGISSELDQAAVEAAEKWRFEPATKEGKPVSVRIAIQFDFQP